MSLSGAALYRTILMLAAFSEAFPEAPPEVALDASPDASPEAFPDVSPEASFEAFPDVSTEASHDVSPDAFPGRYFGESGITALPEISQMLSETRRYTGILVWREYWARGVRKSSKEICI